MPSGLIPAPTERWVVFALLAVHWLLAVTSVREKSVVFDEIAHVTAGYSYWTTDDYRLQPENGNLPQRWGSIPLLLGNLKFPSTDQETWWGSKLWALSHAFFYETGNDSDAFLFRARAFMALVGVALCAIVYFWSRRLFGQAGGFVSLGLAATSPTILGLGPIVTSDLFAALTFTLAVGGLWWTLHDFRPRTVILGGMALGGLFLSKMSAVLILPIAALLVAVRLARPAPLLVSIGGRRLALEGSRRLRYFAAAAVLQGLLALTIIWAAYGFRYTAFQDPRPDRDHFIESWETVLGRQGLVTSTVQVVREGRLLPEAYLYGLAFANHFGQRRAAFLNGEYSLVGWPAYFPYCFLVKSRLVELLVWALALTAWWSSRGKESHDGDTPRGAFKSAAPLWTLVVVYSVAAVASHLNIGHRHLAPVYPPLFILAGAAGAWFDRSNRTGKGASRPGRKGVLAAVVAVALLGIFEVAAAWPHYLAFVNPIAGGTRKAYRHLADSSVDWGQDLPGLKKWLDRRGLNNFQAEPVYLSYFGTGDPVHQEINVLPFPWFFDIWQPRQLFEPRGGIYCISAGMLQCLYIEPIGPWAQSYETSYQALRHEISPLLAVAADPEARQRLIAETGNGIQYWGGVIRRYEIFRLGRLCAWLRQREPMDTIGGSILIYRLTDDEAREALYGPPAELVPEVRVKGLSP